MEESMTQTRTRGPRLSPAAGSSPDAVAGVQQIIKSIYAGGVPRQTLELVHMRASQINGCNACIAAGIKAAANAGVSTEQLLALPAWRESALFDDAERAALALTEAMTRLADHPDAVTDEIWAEAAEHFDEPGLAALVSMIALTNFFNRVNTTLKVQPGSWG
jgi:AhpD family alkylhydroperoxidase